MTVLALAEVESRHIHLFLLHEGERGISEGTRSLAYFALKALYNFLLAIGAVEVNPALKVPIRHSQHLRTEVYTDTEADQILAWASAQHGRRWVIGQTLVGHAALFWHAAHRAGDAPPRPG